MKKYLKILKAANNAGWYNNYLNNDFEIINECIGLFTVKHPSEENLHATICKQCDGIKLEFKINSYENIRNITN